MALTILVGCAFGVAAPHIGVGLGWLIEQPFIGTVVFGLLVIGVFGGAAWALGYAWGNAIGGLIRISTTRRDR